MYKGLAHYAVVTVAGITLALNAWAVKMEDPLRPPEYGVKAAAAKKKKTVTRWHVNEILISGDRRVAIVNDITVAKGERINGAKVVDITPAHVVLEYKDKVIYAQLGLMDIKKKSVKSN